jgi:ATP-dependent RNA helicase RhlE
VNFDLPDEAESYVHRIGRTGRNGQDGVAVTLVDPSENAKLRQVEKIIRMKLPVIADHLDQPDPQRAPQGERRLEPANDREQGRDRQESRQRHGERQNHGAQRNGDRPHGDGFGKKRFGAKPAFAKPDGERGQAGKPQGEHHAAGRPNAQRRPEGAKPFRGKRRFGGRNRGERAA